MKRIRLPMTLAARNYNPVFAGMALPKLYAPNADTAQRTFEFFTANIRNPNTRKAYAGDWRQIAVATAASNGGFAFDVPPLFTTARLRVLTRTAIVAGSAPATINVATTAGMAADGVRRKIKRAVVRRKVKKTLATTGAVLKTAGKASALAAVATAAQVAVRDLAARRRQP